MKHRPDQLRELKLHEGSPCVFCSHFRAQLDDHTISDIRLALNQNQPLGNERFYQHIEQMTGQGELEI